MGKKEKERDIERVLKLISWRLGGINMSQLNSNFSRWIRMSVRVRVCACVRADYFRDMINLYMFVLNVTLSRLAMDVARVRFYMRYVHVYEHTLYLATVSTANASSFSFGTSGKARVPYVCECVKAFCQTFRTLNFVLIHLSYYLLNLNLFFFNWISLCCFGDECLCLRRAGRWMTLQHYVSYLRNFKTNIRPYSNQSVEFCVSGPSVCNRVRAQCLVEWKVGTAEIVRSLYVRKGIDGKAT